MLLDQNNAQTLAAYFGNKFTKVVYCGCWTNSSITFALYQDHTESAGIEVTIQRPEGEQLQTVKVLNVKRLHAYRYDERRQQYTRQYLPIYKA